MSLILLAELNDSDANFIVQLIKKVNGKAKILKGKALDDFHFGQLIDEGMKSDDVPLSKLRAKLHK
jgi:hypothetical protein